MKFLHKLITKIEPPNWVMGILAFIFILRIPSFFEPYYYGDEMIYLTLGNAVRRGITLYSQIHDNKPPLIYLLAGLAGNLYLFKAILMLWMLLTTIIFWHLTKTLFEKNKKSQIVATITFALLTTIPLFEGNIVNAELFLIGPIIFAILLLIKNPTNKNVFLAGLLFAISALFKIPAIFDIPVVVLLWLINTKTFKELKNILIKVAILSLGLIIPILITFIYYYSKGTLGDYVKAAFLQNATYISTWNGAQNQSFIAKHEFLLIRAGIALLGLIIIKIKSKNLSKAFVLATIWLLTSLFAVTLSERPYPHYFIQTVPSLSILVAILFTSQKFEQVLSIIPLTLAILVPVYFKFYYYPTSSYYLRFIQFATSQISKEEYFNKFDPTTNNNYFISQTIQEITPPNSKIFVWGNDAPTIYALSRRLPAIKYVADYHITDFSTLKDTAKSLEQNPPSLIIILPKANEFNEIKHLLTKNYLLIYNRQGSQIWYETKN